jgi:hypothetical protein
MKAKAFTIGQLVRTTRGIGRITRASTASKDTYNDLTDSEINIYFIEFENGAKAKWFAESSIKPS